MASNYNSLGFNLMTTGENAGTWGTNTNLNLNYLRDTFGWITIAMTADRTLTIPDNSTGTMMVELLLYNLLDQLLETGF